MYTETEGTVITTRRESLLHSRRAANQTAWHSCNGSQVSGCHVRREGGAHSIPSENRPRGGLPFIRTGTPTAGVVGTEASGSGAHENCFLSSSVSELMNTHLQ